MRTILTTLLLALLMVSPVASAAVLQVPSASRSTFPPAVMIAAGDTCTSEGWREVANSGPAPRWESAMVADDARGSLFLFGGYGGSPGLLTTFDDTWEWDGEQWHAGAPGGPTARHGHAMAYDRARGRVVLFGGEISNAPSDETWVWDAVSGWLLMAPSGPAPRSGHVMAYDENRKQVILFGGFDGSTLPGDTWAWTGSTWTLLPATGPAGRMHAAMATDPIRKRVVLYGGSASLAAAGALDDTWEFDGSMWTRVERPVFDGTTFTQVPVAGPPARWRHAMAYGASCGRIVITGGETAAGQFAPSTWSWDGASWREGVAGPQATSAAMGYDIAQGKVTLFGGSLAYAMGGQTWQLCTLCHDEAAEMDSLGNVVYPPTLDPGEPITETVVDENLGETGALYPGFHTSADSWLKDYPCATAIGGTVPPEAENPSLDDSLLALGINVGAQALADSMASWETQLTAMFQADPDSLPFAPPVGDGPYVPPAQPYCAPHGGSYVFGGRDIVFVHGLQLDELWQRMLAAIAGGDPPGPLTDWRPPTASATGYQRNPEFYLPDGYYRKIATDNWAPHIAKFLTDRGIQNRFLVIAYPCNDRLEVGIQAMLTQISDAMRLGINVQNPGDPNDVGKFGTPSFVIVSHSTGGLLADAALHAARTYPNLNASFIAERCKAHVALASATSGSRLATLGLVVAGAISGVTLESDAWICPLFETVMAFNGTDNLPPCPIALSIATRSVLVDLVPLYTSWRWGQAVADTRIPTVHVLGAHSQMSPIVKHLLFPGYDDGVEPLNSTSGQPAPSPLWPAGFITQIPLGRIKSYDMGMAITQAQPARAGQFYLEQAFDYHLQRALAVVPFYAAGGPITYLSPTGMLQSVGWELSGTLLDPMERRRQHYTFMSSASDHFNLRSAAQYPDYLPHLLYTLPPTFTPCFEEARALREEDEPAMRARYNTIGAFHYPNDDQPLLTAECTPLEYDFVKGVQRGFKIKVFGKTYSKYWWVWKRHYLQPGNILGKHICDYMYESILNCESAAGLCVAQADAPGSRGAHESDVLVVANPVRGGDAVMELGLAGTSRVRIRIYDLAGRVVHEFASGVLSPGAHRLRWDCRDARGVRVRAGAYFVRAEFGTRRATTTNKVMLIQ